MSTDEATLSPERRAQNLTYAREEVRRHDEARLLATAYAPPPQRAGLIALYAFAAEIDRIPANVSEPPLGLIRLQWWREALEEVFGQGKTRAHPVVELMATEWRSAFGMQGPSIGPDLKDWRAGLEDMLSVQETLLSLDPFKDEMAVMDYFHKSAGTLALLAARWLGSSAPEGVDPQASESDQTSGLPPGLPVAALRDAAALNAISTLLIATPDAGAPETLAKGQGTRLVQTAREKLAAYAAAAGPAAITGLIDRLTPALDALADQSPVIMPALAALAPTRSRLRVASRAIETGTLARPPFAALRLRWQLVRSVLAGRL